MLTEVGFCEVLGIAPAASVEEIRRAYRKAALKCHPDRCPDDPAAVKRFRKITEAYRAAMRSRRRGCRDHKFTPQELAMKDWKKPTAGFVAVKPGDGMAWLERLGGRKLALPTINENAFFVCFWVVAVVLTLVVVRLLGEFLLADRSWESLSVLDIVIFAAAPLATYAAAVAATIIVIVLTRQIVYLAIQLRLGWMRALPGPRKDSQKLPE